MGDTVWERIELRYSASTDLEDPTGYRDGVTVWNVDVRLRDETESSSQSIGEVSAAVTEAAQWDRDERCDMYSAGLGAIATALWVRDEDEVDLDLEVDPDRDRDFDVLLLELIRLEPEHRGSGLGLVITAEIIRILGRGCDAVALLASPWPDEGMTPRDGSTGRQALARHWTRLGFRPVPHSGEDGVMICVADAAERAETRARIRDEVLGRRASDRQSPRGSMAADTPR